MYGHMTARLERWGRVGWLGKKVDIYIIILPCVASLLYKLLKLSMFSCPLLLAHASGPPGHVYYPMVGTIRTVCRDRSSPFERCTSNNRFPSIFNSFFSSSQRHCKSAICSPFARCAYTSNRFPPADGCMPLHCASGGL